MGGWTNREIRQLVAMHGDSYPPLQELILAFSRHSASSISATAYKLGLRSRAARWLKFAHQYFERRESEMRQ